jgi:periplasmic divalent cation tolerance protein
MMLLIAQMLLTAKLAACIQVNQIKSYYTRQGSINIDDEQQLLIKCKTQDFAKIQGCIKENHSYETPEIIQIPITDGSPEYFQWISESVDRSNHPCLTLVGAHRVRPSSVKQHIHQAQEFSIDTSATLNVNGSVAWLLYSLEFC